MALEELDELLNTLTEPDRPAMREMLTRNPGLASQLSNQQTIYRAFVDGDPAAVAAAAARSTATGMATNMTNTNPAATDPAATTASTHATVPPNLTLDQLNTLLNERISGIYSSPQFAAAVEARAKEIATQQFNSERGNLIGAGAEVADQLYSIRATHSREFNEELDSGKFKEFFLQNGSRYGNQLLPAYDAFVSERRIQARIDKGISEGLAARATSDVPGGAVPTTNNPIGPNFVDYSMRRVGSVATPAGVAAGNVDAAAANNSNPAVAGIPDVEQAASAFRALQAGWKM